MHSFTPGFVSPPVSVPPRPALSVPPQPRLRLFGSPVRSLKTLWAWPLMLSLLVVVGVMFWLRSQEQAALTSQREEMISDALSLEAQINGRLDGELAQLRILGDIIDSGRLRPEVFASHPVLLDGIRRFWVSVTWVGPDGRIQAHQPDDVSAVGDTRRQLSDDGGLTGHLSVTLHSVNDHPGGLLVARFSAAALLRQKVPWWLASKYDIRLVDQSDDVIAATVETPRDESLAWYRVALG